MELQRDAVNSATVDSCFGLFGPHECIVALGGPATSTVDLRHQGVLNKPKILANTHVKESHLHVYLS